MFFGDILLGLATTGFNILRFLTSHDITLGIRKCMFVWNVRRFVCLLHHQLTKKFVGTLYLLQ